ncbi:hypothetical protein [Arthrobacter antibioticus]|uniref:hypothetical protein n=1 Tax=Arthrobacter sp. H35-MC1 TaxID=3046203 RepID=UPI0024B8E2FA|nr:hypothetical protein [Arthrobacter sp. H35-MC1]MDJ0318354.1 hypothetical protein [Arthrobacter sp. H35-MC1]
MNVELQAVYKIGQMVSKCPHLEPVIDSNDKTLLTDGHIDVHSSQPHSKANYQGRVSVQVKGRSLTGAKKPPRTIRITKTDLAGYLKNHGVLYFVVFLDPKTGGRMPTYALLNPFKIQYLIKKMGGQKSIGVDLRPFPSDPSKIEGIVKLALQSADEKPSMRIDLNQLKDLTRITLFTDGSLNLDAPVKLTRDDYDFTLVFETSGGMTLSVDEELVITPSEYVGEVTELAVASGDFVFRNPTRRRVDKHTVELELSEGLNMQRSDTGETSTGSVSLTMRKTLRERFNDIGFYLTCISKQVFSIDGLKIKVDVASVNDQNDLREHFQYLKTLMSLCAHLGVDSSLVELEPLEGKRGLQLLGLHDVMVGGEEISDAHHEPGRILQPMGPWSLQLLVTEDKAEGKWLCLDLFHPELGQQFVLSGEDDAGVPQFSRVTPYEVVERERLPFTLNLHLDNLVSAYNNIFEYPDVAARANTTVLNLVRAADVVAIRKSEFLDAAVGLNDWLITKEGNLPIHQINHWQIAARNGQLTHEDRPAIRSLKGQASRREIGQPHFVETACAILLGDEEEVAYCLERLDEAQRLEFQDWPIWDLHNTAYAATDGQRAGQ